VSRRDASRWDGRHAAASDVGPLPPEALRGREELVPTSGRALDVACGRGSVARWLARRGMVVDAVDVSAVGLAAAARVGADLPVRWWRHDLDAGLPEGCTGPYDVVVCQRFRDPALYPALAAALAPGGLLVITVLSEVDEGPGPWRAPAGELLGAFGGLDVLVHAEANGEASLVALLRAPAGPSRPAPGSPRRRPPTS
jgi:2-polyprenyl-3-methyl-5-hydroxy-6-metoxy-1,4-benzoquinol methylase